MLKKHLCTCLVFMRECLSSIQYKKRANIQIFQNFFNFQILFTEFVDWALEKNLDIEDDVEPEAAPAEAEAEAAPAEEAPAAAEEAPAAEAEAEAPAAAE